MQTQPSIEPGQLWENKKTGRVIRITKYEDGEVYWEAVTKVRGRQSGRRWHGYWTGVFKPHTETTEEN